MAKLTDRTELTLPADGDLYVTTDVSDTTDAATGTDKKITWANLKAGFKTYFDTLYAGVLGADDNYVTDAEKTKLSNLSGTNTGDQTITNSSDATSHTVTLSASGGSVQLIEGANVTLTTGGTGSAGTVTIAASGGSGDVTKVGTPADNQVGVWTGDGTIEGTSALTFDGSVVKATNSTDSASVQVLRLDGDRATVANNDEAYLSLYLSNAGGTQTEAARFATKLTTATGPSTDSAVILYGHSDGSVQEFMRLVNDGVNNVISLDGGTTSISATELNKLDGLTPTTTELNYVDGVTSGIQSQIDAKGTGNVTKVGTPVDNQVGVWTGDGTIEGTNNLSFDGDVLTVTNDTDAASNQVLVLQSDRATPAPSDTAYISFKLSDSVGTQTEFGRITTMGSSVADGAENGQVRIGTSTAGTIAERVIVGSDRLSPATNDGLPLGTSTLQWSDLYLAEGGVINWDNGDATLTQTGNVLAVAGADLRVATADVGTNADSVPTLSSTSTFTNKRITKRTGTTTSSATPTINTDNVDEYYITAQTEAITSFTTNLSGTPTLGQTLFISVIGTAARAITWGASFANGPVALPTTTVTTTQLSTLLKWDGSIWRCYATGSTV